MSAQPVEDRLSAELDAVLHLLDRQLVDVDGMLAGKVDDVELTEQPDGRLRLTGLLVGPPALLPRLAGALFAWWRELDPRRADRATPGWIDAAVIDRVGSDVRLTRPRAGLVVPQPVQPGVTRRRLDDLLGMRYLSADGTHDRRRVTGAGLRAGAEPNGRALLVHNLVVGRGRPGSLLGYDRSSVSRPWVVDQILHRVHRHTETIDVGELVIDWDDRTVRRVSLQPPG